MELRREKESHRKDNRSHSVKLREATKSSRFHEEDEALLVKISSSAFSKKLKVDRTAEFKI